jgi:hypothetical protein
MFIWPVNRHEGQEQENKTKNHYQPFLYRLRYFFFTKKPAFTKKRFPLIIHFEKPFEKSAKLPRHKKHTHTYQATKQSKKMFHVHKFTYFSLSCKIEIMLPEMDSLRFTQGKLTLTKKNSASIVHAPEPFQDTQAQEIQ